jgi:mannose-6-phosphate isomerase
MVLETQQSSDTTYRMYDFDRVDKKTGKLRELHLQQSIDTVQVPFEMPKLNHEEWDVGDVHVTQFVMAEYFGVFKLDVHGKGDFEIKDGKYRLLSVLDGSCDLTVDGQTYPLKKGDHLILPTTISCYTLDGQATIIASKPGDEA